MTQKHLLLSFRLPNACYVFSDCLTVANVEPTLWKKSQFPSEHFSYVFPFRQVKHSAQLPQPVQKNILLHSFTHISYTKQLNASFKVHQRSIEVNPCSVNI